LLYLSVKILGIIDDPYPSGEQTALIVILVRDIDSKANSAAVSPAAAH